MLQMIYRHLIALKTCLDGTNTKSPKQQQNYGSCSMTISLNRHCHNYTHFAKKSLQLQKGRENHGQGARSNFVPLIHVQITSIIMYLSLN